MTLCGGFGEIMEKLVLREDFAGGVALLTLRGDAAAKGFSKEGMNAIAENVNSALDDDGIRAIVITGSGRFFCSGADLNEFKSSINDGTIVDFIKQLTGKLHPLQVKMRRSAKICIAAINGAAAGGGLGLALACDARIASEDALLVSGFASLGLSPDGGTTWLMPRLVGDQTSRRFFLNNERWTASKALEYGAVDEVTSASDLISRSIELARKWGAWAKHTRESSKHLLDVQSIQDFETHLSHEQLLIMAAGSSEDFAEGVNAFFEKRKPDF